MKRYSLTIVMAVLLAGLGGYVYWVELPTERAKTDTEATEKKLLPFRRRRYYSDFEGRRVADHGPPTDRGGYARRAVDAAVVGLGKDHKGGGGAGNRTGPVRIGQTFHDAHPHRRFAAGNGVDRR